MASNTPIDADPLFLMAVTYAREAVAADQNQQYTTAVYKYTRAAEILLDFLRVSTNPRLQQVGARKVQEYLTRAKYLLGHGDPGGHGHGVPSGAGA